MKRKMFVLSDHGSNFRSALEKEYTISSGPLAAPASSSSRSSSLDREHILFIDATALDESTIAGHGSVKAALSSGIPIVVLQPSSGLLENIAGFGLEGVAAAIVVQGRRRTCYCKPYMDARTERSSSGTESIAVDEVETQSGHEPAPTEAPQEAVKLDVTAPIEEPDLPTMVLQDIAQEDQIEEKLAQLDNSPWQSSNAPANRVWSTVWEISWKTLSMPDPSGETNRTQTMRFHFTVVLQLVASNVPHRKMLSVAIRGTGFEPHLSSQSMVRNDDKHRGWAQTITSITVAPQGTIFGRPLEYVPENAANVASVTSGFSWNIGFSAGSDGGSLSASFEKNHSITVSSEDFRTLLETVGDGGLRFSRNTYIVGGDTQVDPRYFGFDNLVSQSGWTDQMKKMFYEHISGRRVRSWPSLSRQTVRPTAECVYSVAPSVTGTGTMVVTGGQGANYFYTKKVGWVGPPVNYSSRRWHDRELRFSVNFGLVNYNP